MIACSVSGSSDSDCVRTNVQHDWKMIAGRQRAPYYLSFMPYCSNILHAELCYHHQQFGAFSAMQSCITWFCLVTSFRENFQRTHFLACGDRTSAVSQQRTPHCQIQNLDRQCREYNDKLLRVSLSYPIDIRPYSSALPLVDWIA